MTTGRINQVATYDHGAVGTHAPYQVRVDLQISATSQRVILAASIVHISVPSGSNIEIFLPTKLNPSRSLAVFFRSCALS